MSAENKLKRNTSAVKPSAVIQTGKDVNSKNANKSKTHVSSPKSEEFFLSGEQLWNLKEPIVLSTNDDGSTQNHYLIRPDNFIGRGGSSKIYKAQKLKRKTKHPKEIAHFSPYDKKDWALTDKEYAVKVLVGNSFHKEEEHKEEVEIMKKVQFAENEIKYEDNELKLFFLITDLIPGQPLQSEFNDKSIKSFAIKKLTLLQRTKLILEIVNDIYRIHKKKIIHCDIKPANIQVNMVEKEKAGKKEWEIQAKFVDWGNATNVENDNPILHPSYDPKAHNLGANRTYSPQEVFEGKLGVKTDIYTLVPIIAIILGQEDPIKSKSEREDARKKPSDEEAKECSKIPFDTDKIMQFSKTYPNERLVADTSSNDNSTVGKPTVDSALKSFLNRMQSNEYDERPNIKEVHSFFSLLHQSTVELEKTKEKDTVALFDALRNKKWEDATRLLISFGENYALAPEMLPHVTQIVNANRSFIVKATFDILLNNANPEFREKAIFDIENRNNLLGQILSKPRNDFLYLFSRKKHVASGRKVTASMKKILDKFKPKEAAPKIGKNKT